MALETIAILLLLIIVYRIGFVVGATKEEEKRKEDNKRVAKQEEVLQYVKDHIIKDTIDDMKYSKQVNEQHIIIVKKPTSYYQLQLKKIHGYNDYTYTMEKLNTGHIDSQIRGFTS